MNYTIKHLWKMNLKEKGLICFEEITDYSLLSDEKVTHFLDLQHNLNYF